MFGFLWLDSFQEPAGSSQIHDFTPGIAASGLFCTTRVPDSRAPVSPGSGPATWTLENVEIGHFHDPLNSLHHGKPV
jgi:hypothetical protein